MSIGRHNLWNRMPETFFSSLSSIATNLRRRGLGVEEISDINGKVERHVRGIGDGWRKRRVFHYTHRLGLNIRLNLSHQAGVQINPDSCLKLWTWITVRPQCPVLLERDPLEPSNDYIQRQSVLPPRNSRGRLGHKLEMITRPCFESEEELSSPYREEERASRRKIHKLQMKILVTSFAMNVQRREVLEILQNELNALVRKLARRLAQELNSIQTIKLETLSRRESLGPSEDHIRRLCHNVRALVVGIKVSTCLVVMSVIVVTVLFIFIVMLIRLTQ
ncbi:hypothetical protein EV421DRAFT_2021322 [Armillaria borealis]|uniref:Uncharacterized protein n=1 Tax=Armillaria borealis TaxID=47425 RepID=A0AA39MM55_9AGAR|nr:hypothetical protein EV421DRAFT_2021322 [Armillaria borealis]